MEERKNPLVRQLQITAEGLLDRMARTPAASVAGIAPSESSTVRLGDKLSDRCVLRCFHPSLPKFSDPTLPLAVRSPLRLAQTLNPVGAFTVVDPSLVPCPEDTIDELFGPLRGLVRGHLPFSHSFSSGRNQSKADMGL